MIRVGITGNMGSGKTTVCKIFKLLDIDIYYADDRAKEILHSDKSKKIVRELFGNKVFDDQGNLVNHKLARIVFNDTDALKRLNSLIHPLVIEDFDNWANVRKSHHYVLKEAALLYETGSYKNLDKIIVVASPVSLMIERVQKHDNVSAESIKKRLANQTDQQTKINKADYVIRNDEKKLLIPQVIDVHSKLLKTALNKPEKK